MQPKKLNLQGNFAVKLGGMIGMGGPPVKKPQPKVIVEEKPFEDIGSDKPEEDENKGTVQEAQKNRANLRTAKGGRRPPTRKVRVATTEEKVEEHPLEVDPNVDYLAKLDNNKDNQGENPEKTPESKPKKELPTRSTPESKSKENTPTTGEKKSAPPKKELPKKQLPTKKELPAKKELPTKTNPENKPKEETPTTGIKIDANDDSPKDEKSPKEKLKDEKSPKEKSKDEKAPKEKKTKEKKVKEEKLPKVKEEKPPKEEKKTKEKKVKEESSKETDSPKEPKPKDEKSPKEKSKDEKAPKEKKTKEKKVKEEKLPKVKEEKPPKEEKKTKEKKVKEESSKETESPKEPKPKEEKLPKEPKPKKEKKTKEKPPKETPSKETPTTEKTDSRSSSSPPSTPKKEITPPSTPKKETKDTPKSEKTDIPSKKEKKDTKRDKKKLPEKTEIIENIRQSTSLNSKDAQVHDALNNWMDTGSNSSVIDTKKLTKNIVILGGGTAGLLVLRELYFLAENESANIYLVEPNSSYTPFESIIYSLSNGSPVDVLKRDYTHLNFPLANFIHDNSVFIDTDQRVVHIKSGSLKFDFLVISTPTISNNSVDGLSEASFDIFDLDTLHHVRKLAPSLTGDIVVALPNEEDLPDPFFPYHFIFLLCDFLLSSHFSHNVHFVSSSNSPLSSFGNKFSDFVLERLNVAKVNHSFASSIDSVDYCAREIKITKSMIHGEKLIKINKSLQYGLLICAFKRKGLDVLDHSGLLNDDGYVPASPETLLVDEEEDIYVIGDSARYELPYGKNSYLQTGYSFYKSQAKIISARIDQTITEKGMEFVYDSKMDYHLYVGNNEFVDVEAQFLPNLQVNFKTSQKNVKKINEIESDINKNFF
eukprot:TRINITY_DN1667_c0_g1_i1.p1 TRINITY_DN1667_c0_g1~~TRINITY_DN1667_c0_g1_i1.p1  ORF type:complete len:875 (-),score=377.11 TRINITY_DN1667_c0_g1_i1:20-2644(-)